MAINYFLIMLRNDIRNIFRDKMLVIFCFMPLIMIMVMRFLLPVAEAYFPVIVDYKLYILAAVCLVSIIGPALLSSMIMLDEKDENLFVVLNIMPLSPGMFIFFRLVFITLLAFFASWITMLFSGIERVNILSSFLLSVQAGLIAPVIALFCVSFARNKIEGVTLLKGLNFFSVIPLVLIFSETTWEWVGAIIPFYWVYKAFAAMAFPGEMILYVMGGVLVNFGFIYWLYRRFFYKKA
ncbi:MAG: hypothetical protein R3C61_02640 [Bacteroidia bacterium]